MLCELVVLCFVLLLLKGSGTPGEGHNENNMSEKVTGHNKRGSSAKVTFYHNGDDQDGAWEGSRKRNRERKKQMKEVSRQHHHLFGYFADSADWSSKTTCMTKHTLATSVWPCGGNELSYRPSSFGVEVCFLYRKCSK
jgi:hypothetical protein